MLKDPERPPYRALSTQAGCAMHSAKVLVMTSKSERDIALHAYGQANKVKRPLLLIHGEDDNNTGTFPMQSERFYAALKGHGATTRLVLLPHESHGYSARESVMHVLAETDEWLRRYCEAGQAQQQEGAEGNGAVAPQ